MIHLLTSAADIRNVVYLSKRPCYFCELLEPILKQTVDELGVQGYAAVIDTWSTEDLERVERDAFFGTRITCPYSIAFDPDAGYGRHLLGYAPKAVLVPFITEWALPED